MNNIQLVTSGGEVMETDSTNVIEKLSEITLKKDEEVAERTETSEMTDLLRCDVLQN